MKKITPEEASLKYGVTTDHEIMDNEQLRFRLTGPDGSRYVRTVGASHGAWQKSHYHKHIKETYIVESGWIGYAELVDDKTNITTYCPDDIFTTRPNIPHNVYLPAGTVIHTVKHGSAAGSDWIGSDKLNEMTDKITLSDMEGLLKNKPVKPTPRLGTYDVEYRHFDNLIWQAPAWCTAVFVAALIGTGTVRPDSVLSQTTGISPAFILRVFISIIALFMLSLNHAVYRFRVHQSPMKTHRTPILSSGQFYLHSMVRIQSFCIFSIMLVIFGVSTTWSATISIGLLLLSTICQESHVRKKR